MKFLALMLCVTSASLANAETKEERAYIKQQERNKKEFSADYRKRMARGDDATAHGYQPCRDGGRCGYGYGYGYGYSGYGGGWGNTGSVGWSRSGWGGSDIPTTSYSGRRR